MRNLILFLALALPLFGAPLASTCKGAVASGTTAAINTTGATLLTVTDTDFGSSALLDVVSDSNGNTWQHLTNNYTNPFNHSVNTTIWYAWDHGGTALSVGAGHTVTLSSGNFVGFCFAAWGGTQTSSDPLDRQDGNGVDLPATTITVNSITPSVPGCLVITSLAYPTTAPFINGAFAVANSINFAGGVNEGNAVAYWLQTTATATTGTIWTMGASGDMAAAIASFKPSGAAAAVKVRHRVINQ